MPQLGALEESSTGAAANPIGVPRSIMEGPPGALTVIDGETYTYFGGTSYFGLAQRPAVIEAACAAMQQYGLHTATSRSGFGNNPLTLRVERLAAQYFGTDDSFYFVTGYAGGQVLAQALASRCDVVAADASAHYSLIDAAQMTGKPLLRFKHRDPADLDRQLRSAETAGLRPLVMTDGVFPLSGGVAPVPAYLDVLRRFRTATLLVDDAHGVGTLGDNGRGTLEHFGLWGPPVNAVPKETGLGVYTCGTLSKAIGGHGGIVAGSAAFIDLLRSSSHYYNGASASAAPVAGATACAIQIAMDEPQLREKLHKNVAHARAGLRQLGLPIEDSPTPIIAVITGSSENMQRIHRTLRGKGIIVPYIATYAGVGTEGVLRIAIFATHSEEMIERLLGEMAAAL